MFALQLQILLILGSSPFPGYLIPSQVFSPEARNKYWSLASFCLKSTHKQKHMNPAGYAFWGTRYL